MRRTIFPRCPWCHETAKVWKDGRGYGAGRGLSEGGWIAGCTNPVRAVGPPSDCAVCPRTMVMASPAAAIREWRKILLPTTRNHQAPEHWDSYKATAFAKRNGGRFDS